MAIQALALAAVAAYSAVASFALLKVVSLITPLRVSKREEGLGLDVSQHGEEAYVRGEGALLILPETLKPQAARAVATLEVA
jgi:Amt family ammonium transporter